MPEEMTSTLQLPRATRVRHNVRRTHVRVLVGVRTPHNWLQLIRFGAVGASGFVVNLIVFALCVHVIRIDYRFGSVLAYLVSVTSNFWLNRHWTFSHKKEDHPGRQAVRFLVVSLAAYGIQYLILVSLVGTGMDKVISQALAVIASTPLSFIGQKLWSFRG